MHNTHRRHLVIFHWNSGSHVELEISLRLHWFVLFFFPLTSFKRMRVTSSWNVPQRSTANATFISHQIKHKFLFVLTSWFELICLDFHSVECICRFVVLIYFPSDSKNIHQKILIDFRLPIASFFLFRVHDKQCLAGTWQQSSGLLFGLYHSRTFIVGNIQRTWSLTQFCYYQVEIDK